MMKRMLLSLLCGVGLLASAATAQVFDAVGAVPAAGDTGVEANPYMFILFDRDIVAQADVAVTVEGTLSGPIADVGYDATTYSAEISVLMPAGFTGFQPGETVTVTLTGTIEDTSGNTLNVPYSYSFAIAGGGPPTFDVVSSVPVHGDTGVSATTPMFILFDREIVVVDAWATVIGSLSGPIDGVTLDTTYSAEVGVVMPAGFDGFQAGETVTVTLDGDVRDLVGNTLNVPYSYSFTVAGGPAGPYDLTLLFTGYTPDVEPNLSELLLRVVEVGTSEEVARASVEDMLPDFAVHFDEVLKEGMEYQVDFYLDANNNGMYDVPPTDHAWRASTGAVTGDVVLPFPHNTSFTDIMWPAPGVAGLEIVDVVEDTTTEGKPLTFVFNDSLIAADLSLNVSGNMGGAAEGTLSLVDGAVVLSVTSENFADGEIIRLALRGLVQSETQTRPDFYRVYYFIEHNGGGPPPELVATSWHFSTTPGDEGLYVVFSDSLVSADVTVSVVGSINGACTPIYWEVVNGMLRLSGECQMFEPGEEITITLTGYIASATLVNSNLDYSFSFTNEEHWDLMSGMARIWVGQSIHFGSRLVANFEQYQQADAARIPPPDLKYTGLGSGDLNQPQGQPRFRLISSAGTLDTVTTAPMYDMTSAWVGSAGPAQPGQLWAVWTNDSMYVVFQVTGKEDFGDWIDIQYRIQRNRSNDLSGTPMPIPFLVVGHYYSKDPKAIVFVFNDPILSASADFALVGDMGGYVVVDSITFSGNELAVFATDAQLAPGEHFTITLGGTITGPGGELAVNMPYRFDEINEEGGGGVVWASGMVDNNPATTAIGEYFNFEMRGSQHDTTGAHIRVDTNEGGGFQPVSWWPDTALYRRIATSGSLDTIMSVPEYDGTNYKPNTWYGGGIGTNGAPVAVGEIWAVRSRGTYAAMQITDRQSSSIPTPPYSLISYSFDYKWQPNGSPDFYEGEQFMLVNWRPSDVPEEKALYYVFNHPVHSFEGVAYATGSMGGHAEGYLEMIAGELKWTVTFWNMQPGELVTITLNAQVYDEAGNRAVNLPFSFSFVFEEGRRYNLTFDLDAMMPDAGHTVYARVIDESSGGEVGRQMAYIETGGYVQMIFPGVLDSSRYYRVDFFVDVNNDGMYQMPPADHAWRLSFGPVMGDVVLNFAYNTNFTDIMWPQEAPRYGLTVNLSGFGPHVGKQGFIRIVDLADGSQVMSDGGTIEEPSFPIEMPSVLEAGHSYTVDLFIDVNGNHVYDAPPVDAAWRLETGVVSGYVVLNLSATDSQTDIMWPAGTWGGRHLVYGHGTVDDMPDTPYGKWFTFLDGTSMGADTTDAHINRGNKYGPGFKSVNIAPDIGQYLFLGMGALDTVTSVPAFTGSNYWLSTYESGSNHESLPVQVGELWAVYSRGVYAVVQVTGTQQIGEIPDHQIRVDFRYLMQPDGTPNFGDPWLAPLLVKWIKPDQGSWGVPQDAEIVVQFSEPIDQNSLWWDGHFAVEVWGDESGHIPVNWWFSEGADGEGWGSKLHLNLMRWPNLGDHVNIRIGRHVAEQMATKPTRGAVEPPMVSRTLYRDFKGWYNVSTEAPALQVNSTWPNPSMPVDQISIHSPIQIWFSQPLDKMTINNTTVPVYSNALGPVNASFEWREWENSLWIHHPPFGLNDSVVVTVTTGVKSVYGAPLAQPYVFGFRTRAVEPLRIVVPDMTFPPGSSFALPVSVVDDVTGRGILSFQFTVDYDPWALRFDSISVAGTITAASGWSDSLSVSGADTMSGWVNIAAAHAMELQGAGPLVWLHFTHNPHSYYDMQLWVYQLGDPPVFFNEGDPAVQIKSGNLKFMQTGTIHGIASYAGSGVPVDSVLVYLYAGWGEKLDSTVTAPNGYYQFPDLQAGGYMIQAWGFKQGGRLRAISAMDASFILQQVVGNRQFVDFRQYFAADVTFNGSVTAYDGAGILTFAVGLIEHFGGPDWLTSTMDPYSRQNGKYVWLESSSLEFNIDMVLLGDVTFNWGLPLPKAGTGAPRIVDVRTDGAAGVWRVRLDGGEPLFAADVVMSTTEPVTIAEVAAAEGWQVAWRAEGSTLRIALAGAEPITDPTSLLTIRTQGNVAPRFERVEFVLNEGAIRADVQVNRPRALALHPAAPNPFNPSTQLTFELPEEMAVRLTVVNALGQHVRTLVDERKAPGVHRVTWNAMDDQGRDVASGLYIVSLRAADKVLHQRVLLVK